MCNFMKKNFISGAVCPQCRQTDTMLRIIGTKQTRFTCINCDFNKNQTEDLKQNANASYNVINIKKK
ncbi:MAG: hypothetical protein CMF49_07245 [Legionellales bacterium]|nr:hypothetical protein [Legionellales bacterium]